MVTTVLRSCNLCEAGCGLKIEVENNRIVAVQPDENDPHSHGYVCPKGLAIADIHHDPDRLHRPMRKGADGRFHEISWDDAFSLVGSRLREIRARHGADAIASYFGNPLVHSYSGIIMMGSLLNALGSRNRTSAGSQDTSPRFAASYYLYGNTLVTPVPDIDRTDYFLCVGANPAVSQGSAMVTPNVRARIRAIQERGGKVITVDPRCSETAKLADEHVFIRPGGDAAFLLAMVNALIEAGRIDRAAIGQLASGWDEIERRLPPFTPERTAPVTGIDAHVTRRLALEFAAARGVAYTRVGTCNNAFGTLATWANDLLNLVTGRLGVEGGAMFPEPALDGAQFAKIGGMNGHARWRSRVRGLPETGCDLPASILAEEIETPGAGQVRAMITVAGNPVLSTPNGPRLDRAFDRLEFMVSVDLYINETTRHADVILPPCWALAEDHSEPLAPSVSLRNAIRWCPPVIAREPGELADWEILLRLAEELGGGPTGMKWVDGALRLASSVFGWHYDPERTLDLLLRVGPHGDRFLPWKRGINLASVKSSPHGVDRGPARPGFRHRLQHPDGKVHLVAEPLTRALAELEREINDVATHGGAPLLLIGRRELRTNNSWMHNVPALVSGRERCVLYVHPRDAESAGLRDSEPAMLESRVHSGVVPVRVTDEVMPGVVSLPHGWGHAASAAWQSVAGTHPGVSANDFTDDQRVESVVGQSILNGVPVHLRRVEDERRERAA